MNDSVHIKYLLSNEQDLSWGLIINTVGHQLIKPNEPYPSTNHPMRYSFSIEKGRILNEYQLVYISEGKGSFVSSSKKITEIKQGNLFLLFPGEWHNYRPEKSVGWYEYWIGFEGINMDNRIKSGFFNKKEPVFNIGINDEIIHLYKLAVMVAQNQSVGFQQMLAGIVNLILGYVYSENKLLTLEDLKVTNQINMAKVLIADNYYAGIRPEEIAQRVNMSYSWFRRIFKEYTGFAPSQYIQELKVQKSKELLTNTTMTSQEIAFEAGFETPYYFCLVFKKKTGYTPMEYRELTQGNKIVVKKIHDL